MANQNNSQRTVADKCGYYEKRINNPKLTDGQRRWAQRRLNQLCGNSSAPAKKPAASTPGGKYTDAQKYAYGAGIGYARAKAGKRVEVKEENKESFRDGLKRGKGLK